MNQPENTYSQVIFKESNDDQAKNLVNSYRFQSPSPSRYKLWTPEIQNEEVSRRKRQREDQYIHQFDTRERPVLVIQNKEDFQNKHLNLTQNKQEGDQYIKRSDKTKEIENPQKELLGQTSRIRQQTQVHSVQKTEQKDNNTHLYKIEGIEFLPQGFLELDPLLYHDEFAFENDLHKEIFSKEQRRLKAVRRKQYEMRKEYKMRNVTLFITDDKTDRVMRFLEQWYFKKRREMNKPELELAAQELEIDPQALSELQKNYLNFKRIQNVNDLRKYLIAKGRIQGDDIDIPNNLQKYFVKNDLASTITSQGTKNGQSSTGTLSKSQTKTKKAKAVKNMKFSEINFNLENSQQFQEIRNTLKQNETVSNYFDNEVNKILQSIQEVKQNKKYSNLIGKPQLEEALSQSHQTNAQKPTFDYETIQEILKRLNSQQNTPKNLVKTPKQEYLEMVRQKLHNEPKVKKNTKTDDQQQSFSKLKKKGKQNPSKNWKSQKVKKDRKQINLKYQTDQGEYMIVQKLDPILIGNHYYHLSIEEHIPKSGSPSVNLITRDEQGVVISVKPLQLENLSKFYETKVFIEPQNFTNDNQFVVVVENEEGNTISTQKIREKLPLFINENSNPLSRATFATPLGSFKDQKRNNTLHVLQPVNIGDQFYQQVLQELLDEEGQKHLQVVTHDSKGVVLAQELVKGDFGEKYTTVVAEDFITKKNQREFSIVTKDNKGNEITRHYGTQANRNPAQSIIAKDLRKGRITEFKSGGKVVQVYSIPVAFNEETFFKQKLYEEIDTKGQRTRYISTINDRGEVVSQDFISPEFLANDYYTEILKEFDLNGIPHALIATKNDREEVMNMKELSTYHDDDGNKLLQEFQKCSKRKTSYVKANEKKSTVAGKCHVIHPIVFKNQFLQQNIQEQIKGQFGKTKLNTYNEKGQTLSSVFLPDEKFRGKLFQTKVTEGEDQSKISVITLNELGDLIWEQELQINQDQVLNDQFVENFDNKARGKTVLVGQKKNPNNRVTTYELRPAFIENNTFQQTIIEFEDEFKEKERILITKDENGKILQAESIKADVPLGENIDQKFMEAKEDRDSVFICLFNQENEEIGNQLVTFGQGPQKKSTVVRRTQNKIRHTTQIQQCGLDHYEQVIEEVLNGEKMELKIKNLRDGVEVEELRVSPTLVGNSYYSKVVGSMINKEGKRKTTIQVHNDKDQMLGQFQVYNRDEEEKFQAADNFDGMHVDQIRRNTIESQIQTNGRKTTIKKLRPTQVGRNTYDCYFEEVIGDDGFRRLTLIIKDDDNKEVGRKEVEPDFMADEYECFLEMQLNDMNQGKNLVFRNSQNRLLKVDKLLAIKTEEITEQNFDEIKSVFDDQGRKQSTIYTQKTPRETLVSHRLKPTLIGTQHYQVLINEVLEGNKKARATLVIINEEGSLICSQEIPVQANVENYYSEILEDVIAQSKERKVTLVLRDQNKRELTKVDLSKDIQKYYQDLESQVIEEILEEESGKKRVSALYRDNLKQVLQTMEEEIDHQEENQLTHSEKVKQFEKMFSAYGDQVKANRFSVNQKSQTFRKKAQTINVMQNPNYRQSLNLRKITEQGRDDENVFTEGFEEASKRQSNNNGQRKSSVSPQTLEKLMALRNSTVGKVDEQDLQKQVSMLLNENKDKMIEELMGELLEHQNSLPEDELEEFLRFCSEELISDEDYKDQILMVSLFYYFLKKGQGWKLN